MPYRKVPLAQDSIYHIYTKSIAGYKIFNYAKDYKRMIETIDFYTVGDPPCKFSLFLQKKNKPKSNIPQPYSLKSERIVKLLAYCIMPTHIHLILQQIKKNSISRYMNLILKSFTKYYNVKCKRKGPLWESRFKNALIETDEQLLHLTRYLHLNPVTAHMVEKPQLWHASSYNEYLMKCDDKDKICRYDDVLDINPTSYRKFVEDQISYQRTLKEIKDLVL